LTWNGVNPVTRPREGALPTVSEGCAGFRETRDCRDLRGCNSGLRTRLRAVKVNLRGSCSRGARSGSGRARSRCRSGSGESKRLETLSCRSNRPVAEPSEVELVAEREVDEVDAPALVELVVDDADRVGAAVAVAAADGEPLIAPV